MSHSHKHQKKSQKTKHALEALQKNKEMAEEANKQLLADNNILHISKGANKADDDIIYDNKPRDEMPFSPYIKNPEDIERITKNTSSSNQQVLSTVHDSNMLQSLFAFQFKAMTAYMEAWGNMMFPKKDTLNS